MSILRTVGIGLRWLFGFVLPLFAFGFELWTHKFSGGLYDIMPTPWHALLWLCMPLSFMLVELQLRERFVRFGWLANFLHGISFPVALLHLVAVGTIVILAVLMLPWLCFDAFLSLLGRPGLDLFDDFAGNSLMALTPLGVFICWILSSQRLVDAGRAGIKPLVVGAACGCLALAVLEVSAVAMRDLIVRAVREVEDGRRPSELDALRTSRCREVMARLAFPGHQFSSAGSLYAVGPVDVFGPMAFISDNRREPTHASSNLSMKSHLMLRLYHMAHPTSPQADPIPRSWRGLSRWELEEKEQRGR